MARATDFFMEQKIGTSYARSDVGSVDEKDTRHKRGRKGKIKNRARNANCVQAQPGVAKRIRTSDLPLRSDLETRL